MTVYAIGSVRAFASWNEEDGGTNMPPLAIGASTIGGFHAVGISW